MSNLKAVGEEEVKEIESFAMDVSKGNHAQKHDQQISLHEKVMDQPGEITENTFKTIYQAPRKTWRNFVIAKNSVAKEIERNVSTAGDVIYKAPGKTWRNFVTAKNSVGMEIEKNVSTAGDVIYKAPGKTWRNFVMAKNNIVKFMGRKAEDIWKPIPAGLSPYSHTNNTKVGFHVEGNLWEKL